MQQRRALATATEVAEFYQVDEMTLKQWRYRGIGPAYTKLGSLVRYYWDDVEAFAAAERRAAGSDL